MADTTKIEWCNHTWTPIAGCDAVSPACANCYAATMAARLEAMGQEKYSGLAVRAGGKGKWTGKVTFWEPDLIKPLQVRQPGRWFLTSMGDVAHYGVTDEQIAELFGVMAVAGAAGKFYDLKDRTYGPHTFLVLTKRPQRLARLLADSRFRKLVAQAAYKWAHNRTDAGYLSGGIYYFGAGDNPGRYWPLPNVFIGCTAEDQARADELRPHMAAIAAAGWRTFVSYEPALGPVDWTGWEFLQQLISGGESGHKARPSHPDWHRGARDWCAAAGVPFLFKQVGEAVPVETDVDTDHGHTVYPLDESVLLPGDRHKLHTAPSGQYFVRISKKAAGRLLDGVEHNGFPEDAHA